MPMMASPWLLASALPQIVQDHKNLFGSRLPEQSQGNRAAFTGVNAGIERLIAALNSRVGDGEPTSGQGLADGSDIDPCRCRVGGSLDADLVGNDRSQDHCAKHLAQQIERADAGQGDQGARIGDHQVHAGGRRLLRGRG